MVCIVRVVYPQSGLACAYCNLIVIQYSQTFSLSLSPPSSLLSSFKQFLELEPQLRDVIVQFHQSRYTSCLRILADMRDTLMLDMYLAAHVSTLYTMIRNKALIQV